MGLFGSSQTNVTTTESSAPWAGLRVCSSGAPKSSAAQPSRA